MKLMLILLSVLTMTHSEANSWTKVSELMSEGFTKRLYPGAVLRVGDKSRTLFEHTVGDGQVSRVYDIASLTKVVATTTSIMMLEETGEIKLTDKVSQYFPEFSGGLKDGVTLEDLLRHRAGLAAGNKPLAQESFPDYIKRISKASLSYKPRTSTVYSDLSFILLGRVVELVSGMGLGEFAQLKIFTPLKMNQTGFQPQYVDDFTCAPTVAGRSCQVHDPTAYSLLPATIGNAGVFSTIDDLSRLARLILNKGEFEGVRLLSENTVQKMITPDGPRGLGWDFTSEFATKPRGDTFPAGISFGHTGYTGTTMWIDPQSGSYYIFLSNRVFLGDERTKAPFSELRFKLSSAIGKTIYP